MTTQVLMASTNAKGRTTKVTIKHSFSPQGNLPNQPQWLADMEIKDKPLRMPRLMAMPIVVIIKYQVGRAFAQCR